MLRRLFFPTFLVAVLTGAMQTPDSQSPVEALFHIDGWLQVALHFAEFIGVLWVFLRYLIKPMLTDALAPIQQEQIAARGKLAESERRIESISVEVREGNETVRQLSQDVGRVLGRTD